ncbi:MAG: glycosyltransferase family 39 protein [Hyphomonadaceae bacterium]|nr:glycosyltransferase family 39 protein [Hyphomonadaceae bacterium]
MNRANSSYHEKFLILILGFLLIRLAGLVNLPLGLHGDEAQYWAWSKELSWGYFTKPPMIAWVIAATTSVFGDAEWAIRISSPILHAMTAYVIFRTTKFLFDEKTGFWAGVAYFLMPAVWLSTGVASTDVPLLLCWAVALNAWVHLREHSSWFRAIQLGLALGFGFLSKYALLLFFPALMIPVIFDSKTRAALIQVKGLVAALVFAALITPNMLWNLNNDFATVTHTAANANIQPGIPFHPVMLFTFWFSQPGVFGPVTFVLLILAIISALGRKPASPGFWLSFFVLSPLLIISLQALFSRANANWAVTAYVAGSILIAHYGVTTVSRLKLWLTGGIAAQTAVCLALAAIVLTPAWTNAVGLANAVKHMRAWPETVTYLEQVIAEGHHGQTYRYVALDKRIIFYDLTYYGLGETLPLKMWMHKSRPQNQAELTAPLPAGDGPYLVINYEDVQDELLEDFERLEPLRPIHINLGGGIERSLRLWAGYGYTPTTTR